ncbi:zinc-binding metallopeptidase [Pedobacter rhizosphaerae]|uniref:Substrate import-associated zinc metallohydrolase lipoprotein n=1 Tax=Pedobacter rhizosphaerae TaxID=390241 RepID=A0A1H9LC07_9SPHI|nr:putative zinc-binding metallopeptidase [Pedobacter rhizosphaerae]SER08900.1 substrate import-associated zinc metallohydrolase lipoprotein [Pedobacter rhizosphaerae]
MNKIFKKGIVALAVLTFLASCKKEGSLNANLDIIDQNIIKNKNSTDIWLDQNFLNPYNIETKYRYDRFEMALSKNITPPLIEQVIPAMETVRDVWIKPFETAGGADFIKRISPKQFVLAGSAEYNSNGTITLGTAEGGRKIVLYVLNDFDKTSLPSVTRMIQVIQHEYTHILNQTVDITPEYQTVSRGGYEANWTQRPLTEAYSLGFITQYARVSPLEDFAEQSSNMLMMGRVKYNSIVATLPADAQAKLKKKENYVVEYFKTAFNIDFYQLQSEVQKALFNISAPVLHRMIGPGVGYTTLTTNPSVEPNQSAEFLTTWNTAKAAVAAIGGAGRQLVNMQFIFGANNLLTVRYNYTNAAGAALQADADYTMAVNATTGVATITLNATQPTTTTYGNMNTLRPGVAAINTYLTSGTFRINWINQIIPGQIGFIGSLGAFYKSTNANSYIYGVMGN